MLSEKQKRLMYYNAITAFALLVLVYYQFAYFKFLHFGIEEVTLLILFLATVFLSVFKRGIWVIASQAVFGMAVIYVSQLYPYIIINAESLFHYQGNNPYMYAVFVVFIAVMSIPPVTRLIKSKKLFKLVEIFLVLGLLTIGFSVELLKDMPAEMLITATGVLIHAQFFLVTVSENNGFFIEKEQYKVSDTE